MPSIDETIQRALATAGLTGRSSQRGRHGELQRTIMAALAKVGLARTGAELPAGFARQGGIAAPTPTEELQPAPAGTFTAHQHQGAAGTLNYKLYVPASHRGQPVPLMVMLHGCKQDPDDFAAGTRMNRLAERHEFLVAYPAQTRKANGGNCWNWFAGPEQRREGREASLIAGVVDDVARRLAVDRSKVFVAGLSAGGAMAQILGHRYPDVFAGIAVHSGLALGAAHDVPSAFAAMRGSGHAPRRPDLPLGRGVRTLVVHGDADATVVPSNAHAVVAQAVASFEREGRALRAVARANGSSGDTQVVITDHLDAWGHVQVRDCRVRSGGHAWFGGSPAGSFTEAARLDASNEVVAFLLGTTPMATELRSSSSRES